MGEWQPIETAPKDGTHVLLWFDDMPAVAHYMKSEHGEWWEPSENLISDVIGAYESEWWMPLPKSPAQNKGEYK